LIGPVSLARGAVTDGAHVPVELAATLHLRTRRWLGVRRGVQQQRDEEQRDRPPASPAVDVPVVRVHGRGRVRGRWDKHHSFGTSCGRSGPGGRCERDGRTDDRTTARLTGARGPSYPPPPCSSI